MNSCIRKWPLLTLLLAAVTIVAGCDWIAEKAGIDEVDVSLGSVGANLLVRPDGASSNSGTVNASDKDLPNVFDVESITIQQENVRYTAAPGKRGETPTSSTPAKSSRIAGSGTVDAFIVIDQAPAFGTRVTITDDDVTGIAPSTIDVGTYDKTRFASCLERFGDGEGPVLRQDYQSLTTSQIEGIVDDALVRGSFSTSVVACTNGDLTGLLSFTELTFNLDF